MVSSAVHAPAVAVAAPAAAVAAAAYRGTVRGLFVLAGHTVLSEHIALVGHIVAEHIVAGCNAVGQYTSAVEKHTVAECIVEEHTVVVQYTIVGRIVVWRRDMRDLDRRSHGSS